VNRKATRGLTQNLLLAVGKLTLLLWCFASPARADISVNPHGQFGGWPASIAVPPGGGQYIYSGEGSGLGVWDVTDKANPALAGGLPLGGRDASEIQFDATGQIAYVANGSGLKVVSLADPDNPTVLGSLATSFTSRSVAVVDATYVLVATSTGGNGWIRVVNVSDPANPTDVGGYDTPGSAQHVGVAGNRAYVADGTAGLLVLDITTPATPLLLGSYNTPGTGMRVRVAGTVAYVADGAGSGLQVLNVANPSNITLLATTENDSDVVDVQVVGTTAYVADRNGRLNILNVASPAAPVRIGSVNLPWSPNRLAVGGNYAYIAWFEGLIVVNVTTPTNPTVTSSYERPTVPYGGTVVGTTGYIADQSRLWVCNFANPAAPVALGKCDLGHASFSKPYPRVSVSGNYAAIAKQSHGMPIVNVSIPTNPLLAGRFAIPSGNTATDVFLNGTLACLLTKSNNLGRLRLINIANPANPTEVGALDTPGDGRRLAVLGSLAAIADGAGGVRLINITNPAAPVEAGHIDPPAGATADLVTLETHPTTGHPWLLVLFNAGAGWQMKSYDVQNPAAPAFINETTSATGHINDLQLFENRAYLAGSLQIVNPFAQALLYLAALQDPSVQGVLLFRVGNFVYLLILDCSFGLHAYVVVDVPSGQLTRVDVTPSNVTVRVGEQAQFNRTGYDANGNQVPTSGTWSATGGTITQGGNYTAGSTAGDYNVTFTDTASGIQGSAIVHITPGALTTIHVEPGDVWLQHGGTQAFTATGYDANNNQVPITNPQWTTTGGGTLSPSGASCTYTATSTGDHTITCKQSGTSIQRSANIQVTPAGETVVDNRARETWSSGPWRSRPGGGAWGPDWLASGGANAVFWWLPRIPVAGRYKVYARWAASPSLSPSAPYMILQGGSVSWRRVNQRINGGRWNLLGTYRFVPGRRDGVGIWSGAGAVCADAVRLVYVGP
jgi:hypothetical protein